MHALGTADIDSFIQQLNHYLSLSGSVRDFYQEGHYHTFVLGLACGMMHTHHVLSNREPGWGYVDMINIPKKKEQPFCGKQADAHYQRVNLTTNEHA
ncbi:MAG: PD-(D/E)XK nuclease domain-containing protein [Gammaproteobacteria bacterium]|nr:PD-(D/E)XK nuclease domain-containing protein [Gammaproteobacteria bacterium]